LANKSVNAGISAQQGFALQRNMALFLMLDNYESKFKDAKYFLSLEHHEDILFCFLDNIEQAIKVETYQSKKKATGNWTLTGDFIEVIGKILKTGKALDQDEYPKTPDYMHSLHFSSNTSLVLKAKDKEKDKILTVNESNSFASFKQLDGCIKIKVLEKLSVYPRFKDENLEDELNNLHFLFIDFNRTTSEQENQLEGKIRKLFADRIKDANAALISILRLFNNVEMAYNQGSEARLSDKSKQLHSITFNKAIGIITTRSKAFDYWRDQTQAITTKLNIKPFEKDLFEFDFVAAFDLFKSRDEAEHQKILKFVKEKFSDCGSTSEAGAVDELIQKFSDKQTSYLVGNTLKATFYAAYFESIYKMED
jgi:hypothetical protein